MTELTLTREKMIENLYLASEEIMLQCMILNRRKLVQAMIYAHGHINNLSVTLYPANTVHRQDVEKLEPLGRIDLDLVFSEYFDEGDCARSYSERLKEAEVFIRYLDHLIAMDKRIEVEIKGVVA